MSDRKAWTRLTPMHEQRFPESLDPLQRFWGGERKICFNVLQLVEASADLPGLRCAGVKDRVVTEDRYRWFWSPSFDTRAGTVVVAFPWCQDFEKHDGTLTDRHVTVYVERQVTDEVNEVLARLFQALLDYQTKIVQAQMENAST